MESDRTVPAGPTPSSGDGPVSGEPHVRLVDVVLRSSRVHADWRVEGGPGSPLPEGWTGLWNDVILRQMDLAGQVERDARGAVQSMLDQLTRLDRETGWFRDDPSLRARAISETLLHCTRLGPAVPSLPAQEAWQRQQDLRPIDYSRVQAVAAARDDWLAAWNVWATTR